MAKMKVKTGNVSAKLTVKAADAAVTEDVKASEAESAVHYKINDMLAAQDVGQTSKEIIYDGDIPAFEGPYRVIPTVAEQIVDTAYKRMKGDVIVERIPYYIHDQMMPSDTWEVHHDLDKKPSVTVVDSADGIVVGDVQYIDNSYIRITFQGAFSGKAYLN